MAHFLFVDTIGADIFSSTAHPENLHALPLVRVSPCLRCAQKARLKSLLLRADILMGLLIQPHK